MSQVGRRLTKADLNLPCKQQAIYLLGKILARKLDDGSILRGRIVEDECYLGGEDKASHSYNGRQTAGNEPMYMPAGTTYVYFIYGMYCCFNISSLEPGAAVLIRALEPIQGQEVMAKLRADKQKNPLKSSLKNKELCNGPSKLCISFNMTKNNCNKIDLTESGVLWLEDDGFEVEEQQIMRSTRVGIGSAGEEWVGMPLRFYILGNPHVSKRDKKAEKKLFE
ncbi:DNA-3-methyladenine glycosylase-like [Tribolium madens]|uniref:DNA-3-methyladenine glycosylase-like n=1 Tax=Tribolium madens TaxID=41895 RepID=UPI001CF747D6|nr:DNA-3-methyladenine glycosylase-like [Tribolium madens]